MAKCLTSIWYGKNMPTPSANITLNYCKSYVFHLWLTQWGTPAVYSNITSIIILYTTCARVGFYFDSKDVWTPTTVDYGNSKWVFSIFMMLGNMKAITACFPTPQGSTHLWGQQKKINKIWLHAMVSCLRASRTSVIMLKPIIHLNLM